MKPPFIRSAYNYDMDEASEKSGLKCLDKSLAQQEFAEESDINYIAERYGLTGEMPQVLDLPRYGDFTGIFDFQTAQNAVRDALNQFMTLPAKIRSRFDNSPQKLLAFLEDPENLEEARFLGLVPKPENTPQDTPQPPKGEPEPKGKGGAPSPEPKGTGDPTPKKTDTP